MTLACRRFEFEDTRIVIPLITYARKRKDFGETVIFILQRIFEQIPHEISISDLRLLVNLDNLYEKKGYTVHYGDGAGGTKYSPSEVDSSHIRQLAHQELIRRGEL